MNKAWYILALLFFLGCQEEEYIRVLTVPETSDYVDLYFYNYDSLKNDPVSINAVEIAGDQLVISLSYSGGCEEHAIDLARIHPSCGTPPLPPPTFQIRHDANGDQCEAWITDTLAFDISRLKESEDSPVTIIFSAREYGDDYFQTELTYNYE